MLVAPLLNPKAGETVLDLCSAPGGKTLHMAMLMENKGEIIAADLYPHRLRLLQGMIERQDINIVNTERLDGRNLPVDRHNYFQRVLLDVPCSGLGVIQRKGELKWRRKEQDIYSLASLQAELLRNAFNALKPGGALVYSACSTEPEETKDIMLDFYRDEPRAEPALLAPLLPPELILQEEDGMAYLRPHEHGLDGFFLARLRKKI
jgi:16S rRNA (cytosine967-C5)-methyltransferase